MNRKPIFALKLATFVIALGYSLILPFMPFYMKNLGAGGRELGWLTAVYALTQTVCAPFWGALSDRIGRKPIISIGMIGYAISLFLFGLASSFWTLFIARSLSGVLSSATSVASLAYVGDSSLEDERCKNMGQLGAAMSVGVMIGPLLGGALAGYSLSLPFFTGAGISLIAFLLIVMLLPEAIERSVQSHKRESIVKDLSRLGRNAIDTTEFLQRYFPSRNVRFITILDAFDTTDGITNKLNEQASDMRIEVVNFANEKIAKDISKNTQIIMNYKAKHGQLIAPKAPYGYRKAQDSMSLLPDDEAALVIRCIFGWAVDGVGLNEIVRRLNTDKVLPPIEFAFSKGLEGNYNRGKRLWNSRTVKSILLNRVYVGDLEQGKERHIVMNTHQGIVSREEFEQVEQRFSSSRIKGSPTRPTSINPLKGKVICGSCGAKMQRRRGSGGADWYFFSCITNNRIGPGNCTGMYVRESVIFDAIQKEIGQELSHFDSGRAQTEKLGLLDSISILQQQREDASTKRRGYYEQLVLKEISPAYYRYKVDEISDDNFVNKIEPLEKQLEHINNFIVRMEVFSKSTGHGADSMTVICNHIESVTINGKEDIRVLFYN